MKNKLVYIFFISIFLVGCYDMVEIDKRAFVTAIGIDKIENIDYESNEGSDRFRITYAIPNLKSDSSEKKVKFIKSTESPVLFSANESLGTKLDKRITFDHTKSIVLGKEVVKDKNLFSEVIDSLERNLVLNHAIPIVISESTAVEILETEPETEPITGLYIFNLFENSTKQSASFLHENLGQFLYAINENNNAIIPKISKEQEELVISGIGVIKDLKLIGFLDKNDTKGVMWIRGEIKGGQESIKYDDIIIPISITETSSDISFEEKDKSLKCIINIRLEANILEYDFNKKPNLFDNDTIKKIELLFEESIKNKIEKVIVKLQHDYKVDILGIESKLKKQKYSLYKNIDNWDSTFQNMDFDININTCIRRIGAIK